MRAVLAVIGALGIIVGLAAAAFFFGGFYSVAGTQEDPGIVHWALVQVRNASIKHHAADTPPANIASPDLIRSGARAFAMLGCVNCHGAPGVNWAKFSEGLHRSARPQGCGGGAHAGAIVLGDQE